MIAEVDRAKGPSETPPFREASGEPGLGFGLGTQGPAEATGGRNQTLKPRRLPSSPGAALAADGAGGAVALLHDHADVGFHEFRHVHHLPGEGESAGGHRSALRQQAQPDQKPSKQEPPACRRPHRSSFKGSQTLTCVSRFLLREKGNWGFSKWWAPPSGSCTQKRQLCLMQNLDFEH